MRRADSQSPSAASRHTTLALFGLLFFSYSYFFGGSGFNQNATFDLTRAMVERRSIDIAPYASNTADISRYEGKVLSNKPPGLSLLAAIPYTILQLREGATGDAISLTINLYLCTIFTSGIAGALVGLLLFRTARRRGVSARWAVSTALLAGLGTPLFAYSTMLFVAVPTGLLILGALLSISDLEQPSPAIAGAALGLATTMNYLCAIVVVIVGAFLLVRSRRRFRDAVAFVAGGVPFLLLLLWYQKSAFGSPLSTSIDTQNPAFVTTGSWLGILGAPSAEALWGITFSPYRGLFFIAPILLLAIPGSIMMARQIERRSELIAVLCVVAFFILVNASFNGWHGGYAIGPRYLIPIIPILVIPMLYVTARFRLIWVVLAMISLFLNLAATAVDPQPPDSLRNPLIRYEIPALLYGGVDSADDEVPVWIRTLYRGHTSTNRVAADEMLPFQKHRPGAPASEWASFNLGEPFTEPGSLFSLLPWGMVLMISLLAIYRSTAGDSESPSIDHQQ